MTTITRAEKPEQRVTIQNVADWQSLRAQHDEKALSPCHLMNHLVKAAGHAAAAIDQIEHQEPRTPVEEKRLADMIISAIWIVKSLGYDPAQLVANRVWQLGIAPKRSELPPEERD